MQLRENRCGDVAFDGDQIPWPNRVRDVEMARALNPSKAGRPIMLIIKFALISSLTVTIVLLGIALAQTADPPWAALTSGGGKATSQNFEANGVIGQPIVGHSSSENFQIDAGLLGGFAVNVLCV